MKNLTIITVLVIGLGFGFTQKKSSNGSYIQSVENKILTKTHVPQLMRQAIVTWYNGRHNKFPEHIGVAHRTLPIGTLVEFRRNGVTQLAVVNDRGPWGFTYKKGKKHYSYDFDISLKLAHILGIKRMGIAAVEYAIKGRIK